MKSEAIVFEGPNKVGLRSYDLPALADSEVLVESIYSTVSPGTELRTLAGREQNASPFPLIPGYSTVGRIVGLGKKVAGLKEGTIVYVRGCRQLQPGLGCSWGGHARHLIAPEGEAFPLPAGADMRTATLTALLATAIHGVDLTHARIREQVAVVGLGLVGQMSARLLQYGGANVVATDLIPLRRQVASDAGIKVVYHATDLNAAFDAHFPFGAEAVLDATGSSKTLKYSLKLLRKKMRDDPCGSGDEGETSSTESSGVFRFLQQHAHLHNEWQGPRLTAQGSYADPIEINYYQLFDSEVKFVVPRVHELKDLFRALELLADPRFSLQGLISETHDISEAAACYRKLQERPGELITLAFEWK